MQGEELYWATCLKFQKLWTVHSHLVAIPGAAVFQSCLQVFRHLMSVKHILKIFLHVALALMASNTRLVNRSGTMGCSDSKMTFWMAPSIKAIFSTFPSPWYESRDSGFRRLQLHCNMHRVLFSGGTLLVWTRVHSVCLETLPDSILAVGMHWLSCYLRRQTWGNGNILSLFFICRIMQCKALLVSRTGKSNHYRWFSIAYNSSLRASYLTVA